MTPNPQSKMLIIDTEQYAGNFERQMCAYVTGQIGDCGVGSDIAEKYSNDIKHLSWWEEHIAMEKDDSFSACARPVSIWPTQGWFNNGMGGHFKDTPENEQVALEKSVQALSQYHKPQIAQAQKRIDDNNFDPESKQGGWTKKACEDFIKQKEEEMKGYDKLVKYPAYLSVVVFVDEFPPQEVWEEFMQRAKDFATNKIEITKRDYDKTQIIVTGFRQMEPKYKLKIKKEN